MEEEESRTETVTAGEDWEVDVLQNFRKLDATNNINFNPRRNPVLSEFDPLAATSPVSASINHTIGNTWKNEDDPGMDPDTCTSGHEYLTEEEEEELSAADVDHGEVPNNFIQFETAGESSESFGVGPLPLLGVTVTHMSDSDEDAHNENVQLNTTTTQLRKPTENNNHIDHVTEEYEKRLTSMSDEIETWKSRVRTLEHDKVELIHERDQAREDLHNIESAFSHLHSKYERMKDVLVSSRKNQNLLESRDLEMQDRLSMSESQIAEMEEEFKDKIASIYSSFEARLKHQDLESTRLRAQLRKLEMKNETLENEVKHKSSEVSKLSLLCDELINKV